MDIGVSIGQVTERGLDEALILIDLRIIRIGVAMLETEGGGGRCAWPGASSRKRPRNKYDRW